MRHLRNGDHPPLHRCFGDPAMLAIRIPAAILLLASGAPAFAHGSHEGPIGWTLDPLLTIPLALTLLIYIVGWMRLSKRASTPVRPTLFLSGWAVLTLSLTSPLHEAGERSFTMHMIEHELIMLVATLLLASSSAGAVLAWGLPRPVRLSLGGSWKSPLQRVWKHLTEPVTATAIQAAVMWA